MLSTLQLPSEHVGRLLRNNGSESFVMGGQCTDSIGKPGGEAPGWDICVILDADRKRSKIVAINIVEIIAVERRRPRPRLNAVVRPAGPLRLSILYKCHHLRPIIHLPIANRCSVSRRGRGVESITAWEGSAKDSGWSWGGCTDTKNHSATGLARNVTATYVQQLAIAGVVQRSYRASLNDDG